MPPMGHFLWKGVGVPRGDASPNTVHLMIGTVGVNFTGVWEYGPNRSSRESLWGFSEALLPRQNGGLLALDFVKQRQLHSFGVFRAQGTCLLAAMSFLPLGRLIALP